MNNNPNKTHVQSSMQPEKRRQLIAYLIRHHFVEDQESLVYLLKEQYQLDIAQSIISRDLQYLKAVKVTQGGRRIYQIPAIDVQEQIVQLAVASIEHNQTLVVIKTRPGLADAVAEFFDTQKIPRILATLAGENTVLIIPTDITQTALLADELKIKYTNLPDKGYVHE